MFRRALIFATSLCVFLASQVAAQEIRYRENGDCPFVVLRGVPNEKGQLYSELVRTGAQEHSDDIHLGLMDLAWPDAELNHNIGLSVIERAYIELPTAIEQAFGMTWDQNLKAQYLSYIEESYLSYISNDFEQAMLSMGSLSGEIAMLQIEGYSKPTIFDTHAMKQKCLKRLNE
ncbi:MAG: hypothetical protein AAGK66_03245 [Pseudomonadota bacterium]